MCSPCNWQLTKKGITARSRYLLKNSQWSDCKFLVGESSKRELVEAHKLYLAASSPVFETMFFGSLPEEKDPIHILRDVKAETFKVMLNYIYIDELKLNCFESARDLYYCAKKYMLLDLAERCSIFMQRNLSVEQVCAIHEFAELFEEKELLNKCLDLMRLETMQILTNPSWKSVAKATISILFDQKTLNINSESDLYVALLVWSKAECERKSFPTDQKSLRSVSGDLVSKIRFLTLSPETFANGPGQAEILDNDEICAIIMNIVSPNSIPMPRSFSEADIRLHEDTPLSRPISIQQFYAPSLMSVHAANTACSQE